MANQSRGSENHNGEAASFVWLSKTTQQDALCTKSFGVELPIIDAFTHGLSTQPFQPIKEEYVFLPYINEQDAILLWERLRKSFFSKTTTFNKRKKEVISQQSPEVHPIHPLRQTGIIGCVTLPLQLVLAKALHQSQQAKRIVLYEVSKEKDKDAMMILG